MGLRLRVWGFISGAARDAHVLHSSALLGSESPANASVSFLPASTLSLHGAILIGIGFP